MNHDNLPNEDLPDKSTATWRYWQLAYIVLAVSWLLAPALGHHRTVSSTLISEFEDPGRPWSWLFRTCDILAALLLGGAVYVLARRAGDPSRDRLRTYLLALLGIFALGSAIDALFPASCDPRASFCLVSNTLSGQIHAIESTVTASALLLLTALRIRRDRIWTILVLCLQLVWFAIFIIGRETGHPASSLLQFSYQVLITLWVADLVPRLASVTRSSRARLPTSVRIIGYGLFAAGILAIIGAVGHIRESGEASRILFSYPAAWFGQHGIVAGVAMMYVSRHLWRGEYRAWQIASILLWVETLKYAVLTPNLWLTILFGGLATYLFVRQDAFDRRSAGIKLSARLRQSALVAVSAIAALYIGIVFARLRYHPDIHILHRHLLGQLLNTAGATLLLAILISLFRPQRLTQFGADARELMRVRRHLHRNATSSEDFFKLWPPKQYWWNATGTAFVAYQVIGNVAFALADPVTTNDKTRHTTLQEFLVYCRGNGWLACFLMVRTPAQSTYKSVGYKLVRIGASAVIDINIFTSQTMRRKWWRWVLNKAGRQGWQYSLASPPHNKDLIASLRRVSDAWLTNPGHVERGFALGYFDESYLQQCRLHLLRKDGEVIAFANELPVFNNLPTATIDLMRYLPDQDHSMPTLLARTIEQLHQESVKQSFDLGFVPLAAPSAKSDQVIRQLGQSLMSEIVAAHGLEQFKNKFDPHWEANFLAFDGDWMDLAHIARHLEKLFNLPQPKR